MQNISDKFTFADLFDQFSSGRLDTDDFDTALWDFVCTLLARPNVTYEGLPEPVRLFYASRFVQWDVGNGGFSQAAYNVSELFEDARCGYLALGLTDSATLSARAQQLIKEGHADFSEDPNDIGELFEEFSESELAKLDVGLDAAGWWATEKRSAYALANRASFESVA